MELNFNYHTKEALGATIICAFCGKSVLSFFPATQSRHLLVSSSL